TRVLCANLNSGNDVCLDSTHDMSLDPLVFLHLPAVLMFVPTDKARCAETGRVYGKVSFDRLQGQAALRNEIAQDGSKPLILKVIENRVVVRNAGDKASHVRLPKIA